MQDINEAYLILKDDEARVKYDRELLRFNKYKSEAYQYKEEDSSKTNHDNARHNYGKEKDEFTFEDETLKKWMENARRQAVELAKKSLADLKGMIEVGTKEAAKDAVLYLLFSIIVGIVVFLMIRLKSN
jgi:curved DNA-binding protein CbpA